MKSTLVFSVLGPISRFTCNIEYKPFSVFVFLVSDKWFIFYMAFINMFSNFSILLLFDHVDDVSGKCRRIDSLPWL